MPVAAGFDHRVVVRLLDFFGQGSQWQRRLWTVGSVTALEECVAVHNDGAVFKGPRNEARQAALTACKSDPGIGDGVTQGLLSRVLANELPQGSVELRMTEQIAAEAQAEYLPRWAAALRSGNGPKLGQEHTARWLGAYLLDAGNSPAYLHRWFTRWAVRGTQPLELADLLDKLVEEKTTSDQDFCVFIPVRRIPYVSLLPAHFIRAGDDLDAWINKYGLPSDAVQQASMGGMSFEVQAPDPGAAVQQVADIVDAIRSRFSVTPSQASRRFEPADQAWVVGLSKSIPLLARRRVELGALQASGRMLSTAEHPTIDSAIELLSHLDASPPGAATSAGWAAIESLLKGTDPNAKAADAAVRMARLVAASFPRAELTRLAREISKSTETTMLAESIRAASTNQERARLLARAISNGEQVAYSSASNVAAHERMVDLLADPKRVLASVQRSAEDSFLRLNRLRNAVMHAGKTDAVGLRATLRVVAPIAGAGMDRIVHGAFAHEMQPLDVVALAERRLRVVDKLDAESVASLLDR